MKPRALDLFSGAGGSAMGLHRAGFEVVGVDIAPQKRYPFEFHQVDALSFPLDGFDLVWASPPCQGYSIMRNLPWLRDREYPLLIEPVRARLQAWGGPWIIENVAGAQRRADMQAGFLCGTMFGLPLYRHRLFQTSFMWLAPSHPRHVQVIRDARTLGGRARQVTWEIGEGNREGVAAQRRAMGIDWMTRDELSQAVPPAYAEYLGHIALAHVAARRVGR